MHNNNKWKWQYRKIIKEIDYRPDFYYLKNYIDSNYKEYIWIKRKYDPKIITTFNYVNLRRYRETKTFNEIKHYNRKYCRGCRSQNYLPNSWSEINIPLYRSWKHISKRKHQWKYPENNNIRDEYNKWINSLK